MCKTEGLVKYKVVSLKPIRMLCNLMVAIFTIPLQTWSWQKCISVPINIMGYLTRNLCYAVVTRDKVFYYQVRIQIKIQQTRVQQYVLMFTIIYHMVMCKEYVHAMNKQHIQCVPKCIDMTVLPRYKHKNNLCY